MMKFSYFLNIKLSYQHIAGLIVIAVSISILLSRNIIDSTTHWIELNWGVSNELFALAGLISGIILMLNRVSVRLYYLLTSGLLIYSMALTAYLFITHRAATGGILALCCYGFIVALPYLKRK